MRERVSNDMPIRLRSKCTNVYLAYIITGALLYALLALSGAALADPSTPAADAMDGSGLIQELNDSTVNDSIAQYPFFVLDVYKPLCNPCERMKAALDELSAELGSQVVFGIIDGRDNQITERSYNITGHPTILVFDNGTLVDRMEGFASKRYIVDRLSLKKPEMNTSRVSS